MRTRLGENGLKSDDSRREAVFEENGREYRARNLSGKRLLMYRVDDEMIKTGARCDYALGIPLDKAVYLIELKGKNLKRASEQLLATLSTLRTRLTGYAVHARVVLSRVQRSDIRSSSWRDLNKQIARTTGNVKHECMVMRDNI
jgi:hypothetical protein